MTQRKSGPDWTQDDAETLFARYARTRDSQLRDRLVLMHQNLVRYLAGKFVNRGEPLEDLIQVGTIGLINAIDRFDAWSLKVPRRLQELNQAAAKAQEELSSKLGRPPTIQEVAERIGASEEETLEAIELGNAYDTVSLDSKMTNDSDSAPLSLAEFVGAEDDTLTTIEAYGDLDQAIEALEPRERAIIIHRFFRDMSQAEVAKQLNISQMHVSRLQNRALQQLKRLMNSET
jgi:RNA polymerase sigma-B factor